jgi:hypothetical protein
MSTIAPAESNGTSTIKRGERRTKVEMAEVRDGLHAIVEADHPMTVRQVFYQAVVAGLIEKTESEYQKTVARLLLEMRRSGDIPYSWIADNTRWMRRPRTYRGLADFIDRHQRAYRRDLWADANTYVEIWCEKEALAGVLLEVTAEYDVPLMVSRGFASESYLYSAADSITDQLSSPDGQACNAAIYYFGDHDRDGFRISTAIEKGLRRLCPQLISGWNDEVLLFQRCAINHDQIALLDLPTRPAKPTATSADWPADRPCVELDAIPPSILRNMVRECIERHVDRDQLEHLRRIESHEREQLAMFGQHIAGGAP